MASQSSARPGFLRRRLIELGGLMLIGLSLFVVLASLTYAPADSSALAEWPNVPFPVVENLGGITGALFANTFIPSFGYTVLLLALGFAVAGYHLIRRHAFRPAPVLTGAYLIRVTAASALMGWVTLTHNVELAPMGGTAGILMAGQLILMLGTGGSLVLVLTAFLCSFLALAERGLTDVARDFWRAALARFEEGKRRFQALWQDVAPKAEPEWRLLPAGVPAAPATATPEPRSFSAEVANEDVEPNKRDDEPANVSASTDKPVLENNRDEDEPTGDDFSLGDLETAFTDEDIEALEALPFFDDIEESYTDEEIEELPAFDDEDLDFPEDEAPLPSPSPIVIHTTTPTTQISLPLELLSPGTSAQHAGGGLESQKQKLLDALAQHNIRIDETHVIYGASLTRFELTPAPGVRLRSIRVLEDDLAMALAANGIRIMAPIPGKQAIGIEVPRQTRDTVALYDLLATSEFQRPDVQLPLMLGQTVEGQPFVADLATMPHLLIAGATGAGKSVGLNSLIVSLLYHAPANMLKFVMIDPKRIELMPYARLQHHYLALAEGLDDVPIVTEVEDAALVLQRCQEEMDRRYGLLAKVGVRSIVDYNHAWKSGKLQAADGHDQMPYIVIVIDELADLMLTAGKAIEEPITRLAQMARAVGIHLIVATQRPSVNVVTGLIKANFPARVAYQVATKIDSRTILDQNGAESLIGQGDLLYMKGSHLTRLQGPFVSSEEIQRIVSHIVAEMEEEPFVLWGTEELVTGE